MVDGENGYNSCEGGGEQGGHLEGKERGGGELLNICLMTSVDVFSRRLLISLPSPQFTFLTASATRQQS